MVHKIEPWDDMEPDASVPRITCSHTLHIWSKARLSIQWLVSFNFIDHFPHIHLQLSFVFVRAVEPHCQALARAWAGSGQGHCTNRVFVKIEKSSTRSNSAGKSHDRRKARFGNMWWRYLFPKQHQGGAPGSHSNSFDIVSGSRIFDNSLEMTGQLSGQWCTSSLRYVRITVDELRKPVSWFPKIQGGSQTGYCEFGCLAGTYGRCCRSVMLHVLNQGEHSKKWSWSRRLRKTRHSIQTLLVRLSYGQPYTRT